MFVRCEGDEVESRGEGSVEGRGWRQEHARSGNGLQLRDGSLITGCLGVSSYDISLEKQEVVVTGTIPYDDLHAKIAKTGKQVRRPRRRSL